jgi:hypothetical protein
MKTHLVANFMWRTTSVKQANLKLRNRLSYYCQLFALFWVMPVRAPQLLTQIQGARTPICAGRLQWPPRPRHCEAKADSHSRFRALPATTRLAAGTPAGANAGAVSRRQPDSAHVESYDKLIDTLFAIAQMATTYTNKKSTFSNNR